MRIINTFPDLPASIQTVTLSGIPYRLTFDWDERLQAWYMGLTTLEGVGIIKGVRLAFGVLPISGQANPPGEFVVFNSTEHPGAIERYDLGSRAIILYVDEEDLDAAI